jgi:uncharacterized protein YbjT (DUF2867 family)
MTTLITGANGTVSSALLKLLHGSTDPRLRALVGDERNPPTVPNIEIAVGDLNHPASLAEGFSGADTVWLFTAAGPQARRQSFNAVWAGPTRARVTSPDYPRSAPHTMR